MRGINTFTLKLIAVVTMLIDHVGAVLFPQFIVLRIIGRIAFPIYAYTLVEGFTYTHDVYKYMLRLAGLAIISEVPFDLAFYGTLLECGHQNIFFTLFLGIGMLWMYEKAPTQGKKIVCILMAFFVSELLHTDYSSMGLLMIFWFYQFRSNRKVQLIGIPLINIVLMGGLQSYATLAVVPIAVHNGKQGAKCKTFFYGFYPIHLIGLYLIHMIL